MNCLVWKGGHCQDPRERASADTTRTLFRVLTPEVASPEQIRGESVTTATDVYALGLLLYLLLTGRSPYGVEARLQGEGGVPNLGDEAAGRRSLMQASALFESLPEPLDVDAGVGLAETHLALHEDLAAKKYPTACTDRRRKRFWIDFWYGHRHIPAFRRRPPDSGR